MSFFSNLGAFFANLVARLGGHTPAPIPATVPLRTALDAPYIAPPSAPTAPAPAAPAPAPVAAAPVAQPQSVQSVQEGAYRVDLPAASGTPGTVTLEKTGHVLSFAAPWSGETFSGYCSRVYKQCGYPRNDAVGALFLGLSPYFEKFGGYKADGSNWPDAADSFYDSLLGGTAYATTDELAYAALCKARAQAEASQVYNGGFAIADLTLDDKLFLAASAARGHVPQSVHFAVLTGTRLQINQVINEAVSDHAAEYAGYDISKYTGPLLAAVNALKS